MSHLTINIFEIPYELLDFFSSVYDKVVFGDFNLDISHPVMFMNKENFINLVKGNTFFKGKGSCIDLILTNRRHSFKHTSLTETSLSDHHHLISSMMKVTFENKGSIVLVYRDYKNSTFNSFKSELLSKFHHNNVTFTSFENNFVNVLNQQAPKKSKVFRGNQKPHLNKSLRAAIMKRSRLKNKSNKSQLPADLSKYKKQRNLVGKLNKYKKEYFENLNVATNSKPFWDKCKPYFSNKHAKGDSNIMLIEKDEILLKNKKIADVFNSYFDLVKYSLDLFSWSAETDNKNTDALQNILKRFHNHPSLIKIKLLVNNQSKVFLSTG